MDCLCARKAGVVLPVRDRSYRDRFARNDGLMRSPRRTLRPSSPANGSAEWPPDDRLRQATQYSEASVMESKSRGGRMAGRGRKRVSGVEMSTLVMAGLDPAIHQSSQDHFRRRWIAGS